MAARKTARKPIRSAIEVIDETSERKNKAKTNECPVCGAPGGKTKCEKCGWSVEELGPDYDIRSGDPVTTLRRAESRFKSVKEELKDLREQKEALLVNNQKFSELVESMEAQLKALRAEAGRRYVYSYNGGGWGELGDVDPRSLHLKKKALTVVDINRQLEGIMKLLRRYKK